MRAVIETTQWGDAGDSYNHVYLLDGDTCLAYIPHGTREIRRLATPIRLDRRGRQFQELRFNPFRDLPQEPQKVMPVRRVAGSKGQVYEVNVETGTCTCPGFHFRGQCRHVESLQKEGAPA
jgi:hypothetical protein